MSIRGINFFAPPRDRQRPGRPTSTARRPKHLFSVGFYLDRTAQPIVIADHNNSVVAVLLVLHFSQEICQEPVLDDPEIYSPAKIVAQLSFQIISRSILHDGKMTWHNKKLMRRYDTRIHELSILKNEK